MVFSSLLFLYVYLPAVLIGYYLAPRRFRLGFLFLMNLVFYGWGEPVYVSLMLFSTVLDYCCGKLARHGRGTKKGRLGLALSLCGNLGLLFFFKYTDFVITALNGAFGLQLPLLGLPLPIGISFYTFQTMSYTVDVYRGQARAQDNILRFGCYVSLFPQLIAGPIVRYADIAAQLERPACSVEHFASGLGRFVLGLCKKVLIANAIGSLWDAYAAMPAGSLSLAGAWLGAVGFAFQIYFDFSGYSDMAIGLGRMLGFDFLENFNYPYVSRSITEFWRRWHISLSTWFREYVYIPLGGNRRGEGRTYLNLFIVWALTGLWHGASWNYLLWGVYFALLLILEKAFFGRVLAKLPRFFQHLITLLLVVFSWAIFALEDLGRLGLYLRAMLDAGSGTLATGTDLYYFGNYALILLIAAAASAALPKRLFQRLTERQRRVLTPALILLGLVLSTAYLVDSTYNPFLYFRF